MDKSLLLKISQIDFYCLDLKLYLNTHPCDREALAYFAHMTNESAKLHEEYERLYGPLTARGNTSADYFTWINEPWPWEQAFNAKTSL